MEHVCDKFLEVINNGITRSIHNRNIHILVFMLKDLYVMNHSCFQYVMENLYVQTAFISAYKVFMNNRNMSFDISMENIATMIIQRRLKELKDGEFAGFGRRK